MEVSAMIFLGVILLIFVILDVSMIVSLIQPGDERKRMIVWKASAYTLLVTVGALIIDVIENIVRAQYMSVNSLVHLETTAIIYCITLLYFKKKHGG